MAQHLYYPAPAQCLQRIRSLLKGVGMGALLIPSRVSYPAALRRDKMRG